jgi:hypothetical protein
MRLTDLFRLSTDLREPPRAVLLREPPLLLREALLLREPAADFRDPPRELLLREPPRVDLRAPFDLAITSPALDANYVARPPASSVVKEDRDWRGHYAPDRQACQGTNSLKAVAASIEPALAVRLHVLPLNIDELFGRTTAKRCADGQCDSVEPAHS